MNSLPFVKRECEKEMGIELHEHLTPMTDQFTRLNKAVDDDTQVLNDFNVAMKVARDAIAEHWQSFRDDFQRELNIWFKECETVFGQTYRTPRNMRGNLKGRASVLANQVGILSHRAHGSGLIDREGGE